MYSPHCRWMITGWDILDSRRRWPTLVEGTTNYIVYQFETTRNGRIHAQAYYQIADGSKGVTFKEVKQTFGKHTEIEYARKSESVCLDYVTKDRTRHKGPNSGPFYLNIDKAYVDFAVEQSREKREEQRAIYAML